MDERQRQAILADTALWEQIGEIAYLHRKMYGTDVHGLEARINQFLEDRNNHQQQRVGKDDDDEDDQ